MTNKRKNIVIKYQTYCELILNNKEGEEIGRAKIDKEDLNKVIKYGKWSLTKGGYIYNHKGGLLHRFVMNARKGEMIDHRKTGILNRRDNRKKNLRKCNINQNNFNMLKRSDNSSGYKGVSWRSDKNKWRAYISVDSKFKHLGYFDTAEEAHKAYCKAAKILHGEFYIKNPN